MIKECACSNHVQLSNIQSKHIKLTLIELKVETGKSAIMLEDSNTILSATDEKVDRKSARI